MLEAPSLCSRVGGLARPCRFSFELRGLSASWPRSVFWGWRQAWRCAGAPPAPCAGGTGDDVSRRMEREQERGFVVEENPGCKTHLEFLCRFARMKIPSFAVLQMLMLTV